MHIEILEGQKFKLTLSARAETLVERNEVRDMYWVGSGRMEDSSNGNTLFFNFFTWSGEYLLRDNWSLEDILFSEKDGWFGSPNKKLPILPPRRAAAIDFVCSILIEEIKKKNHPTIPTIKFEPLDRVELERLGCIPRQDGQLAIPVG